MLRNYEFLERFGQVAPTATPLGKREFAGCVITHESLLPGKPQAVQEFDFERGRELALTALRHVYEGSAREKNGLVQGWIHGDLTYRNMLLGYKGIYLIDFDRSGIAWPEFDLLHLYYDWRVHSEGPRQYVTFMRLLLADKDNEHRVLEIVEPLYSKVPALAGNRQHVRAITEAFAKWCLNYFVEDCRARGASIEWADEIESTVRI